jgi:hypothetical protein
LNKVFVEAAIAVATEELMVISVGHPMYVRTHAAIRLLLIDQTGAAGLVDFEVNVDLDTVGDLDEGDAAVDAIVFAVEGHGSLDGALAGSLACDGHFEGFGFGDSPDGEVADDVQGIGAGLHDFGGVEGDKGVLFDVEEVFAFEFSVFDSASRADGGGLDFNVEDAGSDLARGEGERGVPLIEVAEQSNGGFDVELNGAVDGRGLEDWGLGAGGAGQHEEREEAEECDSHGN